MRQRIQHVFQALPDRLRASRKIDNQRASADDAHTAAQHGAFRHGHAVGTNRLRDSRSIPLCYRHRCLRRHIPPGKSGSARRQHQITLHLVTQADELCLQCLSLIRKQTPANHVIAR